MGGGRGGRHTLGGLQSKSYERFINFKLINGLCEYCVLVAVKIAFVLLTIGPQSRDPRAYGEL